MHDVVVVEGTSLPDPLLNNGFVDVSVSVGDEFALAGRIVVHAEVRAHEELPLEQLHSDDSEHEDQEDGDSHDVTNGLHGDDHTLNNLL